MACAPNNSDFQLPDVDFNKLIRGEKQRNVRAKERRGNDIMESEEWDQGYKDRYAKTLRH